MRYQSLKPLALIFGLFLYSCDQNPIDPNTPILTVSSTVSGTSSEISLLTSGDSSPHHNSSAGIVSSPIGTSTYSNISSSSFVPTAPHIASHIVNNQSDTTIHLSVPVELSGTDYKGVIGYYISATSWAPYKTSEGWVFIESTSPATISTRFELGTYDGTKYIYIWIMNEDSLISERVADTIYLKEDKKPEITSMSINESQSTTDSKNVLVALEAQDYGTIVAFMLSEDSIKPDTSSVEWVPIDRTIFDTSWTGSIRQYATELPYTLTTEGTRIIYGWALDNVGNISQVLTDSISFAIGEQVSVSGTITDSSGVNLDNVKIKLNLLYETIETYSIGGQYELQVPAGTLPEYFTLIASQSGSIPNAVSIHYSSTVISKDITLLSNNPNIVAVNVDPRVHHLGDDNYGGTVNSQFQMRTEGTEYSASFLVTEEMLTHSNARVRFMLKGAQEFPNELYINDSLITELEPSPEDGSFGEVYHRTPPNTFVVGTNTLKIASHYTNGDYDDFEFANILVEFFNGSKQYNDTLTMVDNQGNTVVTPCGVEAPAYQVVDYSVGADGPPAHARNSLEALGFPDFDDSGDTEAEYTGFVTLGCEGSITLKLERGLIDQPGDDLHVFEIGPQVEPTNLEISANGIDWITYGEISGGKAAVDINAIATTDVEYLYVRLTDLKTACWGTYPGAEIDAVVVLSCDLQ